MRYKIGRNPIYRVPIPALIGGINTNSSSDVVGDNQLSNCLNMMAMDGILRTRPGFVTEVNGGGIGYLQSTAKKIKQYDFVVEREEFYGGGDEEYPPEIRKIYGKIVSVWCDNGNIEFFHIDKNMFLSRVGAIETGGKIINEFTINSNDGLYSYVTYDDKENKRCYKIYNNKKLMVDYEAQNWEEVKDIYIPTIMTNCVKNGLEDDTLGGDYLTGINLLTNKYKIEVTAFNELLLENWHYATYKLPHSVPLGATITVDVMLSNGEIETHSLLVEERFLENALTEDGSAKEYIIEEKGNKKFGVALECGEKIILYKEIAPTGQPVPAFVTNNTLWIENEVKEKCDKETPEDDLKILIDKEKLKYLVLPGLNNITITTEYNPALINMNYIFSATCSAWYGGNQGVASGTRLFIGGMDGEYKNTLQWTDLSNPLYFPENCFSKVGDPSQNITGFGKQGDMLVVFKPFEIYAASYVLQDAPIEDAAYDFISDLTVTTAVFPLTQISNNIGCDCPGTIQLCRNRLCWVHSNGKAYTLVSSSQYNEKNIYELSDPIRRELPNISNEELKNASSTDWEGYYVLSAGNHMFLMQYESYGYLKIYSYTSEEAASHKLPWFYLSLPFVPKAVMNIDNALISLSVNANKNTVFLHKADRNSVKDERVTENGTEEIDIPSMVQSKIFDFSRPEIKKTICHILAEIGGTGGNSVTLSVVSDRSRKSDIVENSGSVVSPISQYNEYSTEGKRVITPLAETIERTVTIFEGGKTEDKDIKLLDSSSPDFFRMIRVNPALSGIRKFAVKLESKGAFSLGQVCIEYKMLGSVK